MSASRRDRISICQPELNQPDGLSDSASRCGRSPPGSAVLLCLGLWLLGRHKAGEGGGVQLGRNGPVPEEA